MSYVRRLGALRLSLFISFLLIALAWIASAAVATGAGASAHLLTARAGHTATALADGSLMLAGGNGNHGAAADIEFFDPASGKSAPGPQLFEARAGHSASMLADGRILLAGGRDGTRLLASTEIYDPGRGSQVQGASMNEARAGHTATRLADGRVLFAGGDAGGTAELYDPGSGRFTRAGRLTLPRSGHSAALLANGKVLLVGGYGAAAATAEVFDAATATFTPVRGGLKAARVLPTLKVLSDGKVQVYGGDAELTMEIYNPDGYFSSRGHLLRDSGMFWTVAHSPGQAALVGMPAPLNRHYAEEALGPAATAFERSGHTATDLAAKNTLVVVGGTGFTGKALDTITTLSSCSATVTTDLTDYYPGQTVVMSGSGWQAGEQITLDLHRDTNDPPDTILYATADANGDWINAEYVVQDYDLNVTFVLTATGDSGCSAQTTFTDAPPVANVNFATSGLPAATSVALTIDFINNSGHAVSGQAVNFTSPGPSGNTGTNPGTTMTCHFPSTIAGYTLQGVSPNCAAGATTGAAGSTTRYTATYQASQATSITTVTCPANVGYTGLPLTPCTASYSTSDGLSGSLTVNYTNNTNAGTATASATYAGDATHASSSDSKTFTIDPATSITSVTCPASVSYTGSPLTPCSASYTTSDGLSGSLTVNYANNTNAGTATASATYAGDANHASSSDSKNFTIDPATSITTVTCPTNVTYTGSPLTPCSASYTTSDGLAGSLTVNYANNTNAGTANASASYAGDANHASSSDTKNFTIDPATSVTTVTCPTNVTYTGSPLTPCTAAYSTSDGLSGSLTVNYSNNTNAGTATASASYAGDANHASSSDTKNFTIDPATSVTTVTCPTNVTYTGSPLTPCSASYTTSDGLSGSLTVNYANNTDAGTATASADYAGDANHLPSSDSKNFTIDPAPSTTSVTCPANVTYTGLAQTPCTAGVTGVGGLDEPLTVSYANNTNAGTATASASYPGDTNHLPSSDSTTFTIDPALLTVTADDATKTFGDPNPAFTYKITGFVNNETVAVVSGVASCTTTATQFSPVGTYPITCTQGTLSAQNYTFTFVAGTLTVTPRDALVRYIGQQTFVTSGTSSTTAQVTLSASVQDPTGLGLSGAKIDFIDTATGKALASAVPVSPVPNSPNYTGTANAIVTLSTGQFGAQSYLILVKMTGNYDNTDQIAADKTADVVVAKPAATNETTGGGSFAPLATAAGLYAGNGDPASFTVGMSYNKSGTNLKGSIMLVVPQAGGVLYVKSNSISSMATKSKSTTIYTKASVYEVLNDGSTVTIDGNVTLRMDAQDASTDMVGFTVLSSKDSTLYYSNNWVIDASAWRTAVEMVNPPGFVTIN